MNKQSAVEFLLEKYKSQNTLLFAEDFEQAKEMFEKQIIDASNESFMNGGLVKRRVKNKKVFSVGEQYYNETFKQQEQ
jgi:hypothetical protein